MSAARIAGLLFVLLTAGCAGLERAAPGDPPGPARRKPGPLPSIQ